MWPFEKKKIIAAVIPTQRVLYQFVPTKTFSSKTLKSTYVEGVIYSVREGNMVLKTHVDMWSERGLVKIR